MCSLMWVFSLCFEPTSSGVQANVFNNYGSTRTFVWLNPVLTSVVLPVIHFVWLYFLVLLNQFMCSLV